MSDTEFPTILSENVSNLIENGAEIEKIQNELVKEGIDEVTMDSIINVVRKTRLLRRRKRGFKLGIIGSILLVAGFILTVLFYHSGVSIHIVMYGMTSVGVVLLLLGMIDVLGW